jgi:ankyrin repeat protein
MQGLGSMRPNDKFLVRSLQKRLRDAEGLVPVNVSARNGAGLTMLHVACYQGGYDCARILLEKARADVHSLGNECKSTPLQFAAFSGNVDLVKLLLKYQGKVNHQNAAGKTALHFAAAGVSAMLSQTG